VLTHLHFQMAKYATVLTPAKNRMGQYGKENSMLIINELRNNPC
jgi:hypothetical protein